MTTYTFLGPEHLRLSFEILSREYFGGAALVSVSPAQERAEIRYGPIRVWNHNSVLIHSSASDGSLIDLRQRSERQHTETERYPRREQAAFTASLDQICRHVVGRPFQSEA